MVNFKKLNLNIVIILLLNFNNAYSMLGGYSDKKRLAICAGAATVGTVGFLTAKALYGRQSKTLVELKPVSPSIPQMAVIIESSKDELSPEILAMIERSNVLRSYEESLEDEDLLNLEYLFKHCEIQNLDQNASTLDILNTLKYITEYIVESLGYQEDEILEKHVELGKKLKKYDLILKKGDDKIDASKKLEIAAFLGRLGSYQKYITEDVIRAAFLTHQPLIELVEAYNRLFDRYSQEFLFLKDIKFASVSKEDIGAYKAHIIVLKKLSISEKISKYAQLLHINKSELDILLLDKCCEAKHIELLGKVENFLKILNFMHDIFADDPDKFLTIGSAAALDSNVDNSAVSVNTSGPSDESSSGEDNDKKSSDSALNSVPTSVPALNSGEVASISGAANNEDGATDVTEDAK